jgi:hypothetical protein
MVLVIPSVLAMLGDNPMQSEFACHIGFRGKYFCRVCWVKGDPEPEEDNEGDGLSDTSSASSQEPAADGKKKKKTKKKDESVLEMVSRITQFMSVGGTTMWLSECIDQTPVLSVEKPGPEPKAALNCVLNLLSHLLLVAKLASSEEKQSQASRIHSKELFWTAYLLSLRRGAARKLVNKLMSIDYCRHFPRT